MNPVNQGSHRIPSGIICDPLSEALPPAINIQESALRGRTVVVFKEDEAEDLSTPKNSSFTSGGPRTPKHTPKKSPKMFTEEQREELIAQIAEGRAAKEARKLQGSCAAASTSTPDTPESKKKITQEEYREKKRIRATEYGIDTKSFEDRNLTTAEAIFEIRFSQPSIASKATDGTDLIHSIKTEGWDPSQHIRVVRMPDGKVTTVDNRRVFAAQRIVAEYPLFFKFKPVKIRIYRHTEITDFSMTAEAHSPYRAFSKNASSPNLKASSAAASSGIPSELPDLKNISFHSDCFEPDFSPSPAKPNGATSGSLGENTSFSFARGELLGLSVEDVVSSEREAFTPVKFTASTILPRFTLPPPLKANEAVERTLSRSSFPISASEYSEESSAKREEEIRPGSYGALIMDRMSVNGIRPAHFGFSTPPTVRVQEVRKPVLPLNDDD